MNDVKEILRQRAAEAAKVLEDSTVKEGIDIIKFTLGDESYAIETLFVNEVHEYVEPTEVPNTPSYIEGIVYLRGRFVSVVELKRFLGVEENRSKQSRSLLLLADDSIEFALAVDDVFEETRLSRDRVQAVAPGFSLKKEELITGVCEDGLIFLDAKKILADEDMLIYDDYN